LKLKEVGYKTNIKELYGYQTKKIVDLALEWCSNKFGFRKYTPNIYFSVIRERTNYDSGWYEPARHEPEITINISGNQNISDLINTVIHEYTHYLQPDLSKNYNPLDPNFNYDKHPLEIEAREMAKKYTRKCYTQIKPKF
jgi:hypothetical protein